MFASLLSWATEWYSVLAEATKGNQILGGALMIWVLGVVTMLARSLPVKICKFIARQSTTKLIFNNAGANGGNAKIFQAFMAWYLTTPHTHLSRSLSLDGADWYGTQVVTGPGYGKHYFIYKGRLFWFVKEKLDSGGSELQKEEISITALGRNTKLIHELIEKFRPRERPLDETEIFQFTENYWSSLASVKMRPFESVIINKEIKDTVMQRIDDFYTKRQWYLDKGLSHKLTMIFHGIPGTGKTSFIKALAGKYGVNVYVINISTMTDDKLEKAIASVPKGNFILIEDFDSSKAVKARNTPIKDEILDVVGTTPPAPKRPKSDTVSFAEEFSDYSMLSLTGVLNALDGIVSLDNTIIFMTTNHIDKIDEAILRKGRCDLDVEIGQLNNDSIKEYINYTYGNDKDLSGYHFKPITGCNLQDALLINKDDFKGFMETLRPYWVNELEHEAV